MAIKTATVTLEGDGLRFVGSVGSGHTIVMDDGVSDTGARPSELIPLALAGCTGMDVISILRKKRQDVRALTIETQGHQMDAHPNAFTRIDVTYVVTGVGVDPAAVARAIELSATKYCAVGSTLSSGNVEIVYSYRLIDAETGAETSADVLTEGPGNEITQVTGA